MPSLSSRISEHEWMRGLLSALAEQHLVLIGGGYYYEHKPFQKAYEAFRKAVENTPLRLNFFVKCSSHGESDTVRKALAFAAMNRLITFDAPGVPHIRLHISKSEAAIHLDSLPGTPDIYRESAQAFLTEVQH